MSSTGELDIRVRRPSTPGSNTQVLFNDAGVDGANANLTFDKANNVLSVGAASPLLSGNGLVYIGSTNAAQILLNSRGIDFGVISNPNNQVWSLGYTTNTTATMPTGNVLSWTSTGNVGIGTTAPVSKLDVRSGWITSGDAGDTTGAVLLGSWRANGELLTTYGTRRSTGGPLIGYACRSNTQGTLDFWSTYSSAIGRSAIAVEDGHITFFTGAAQTVANGSPLTMSEVMRIDNTPFIGISGNGSAVTGNSVVAAGRASIVLGSGTDAALVFQNTGAFCGGYVYSTNTEMRIWGSTLSQTTLYAGGALAASFDTSQHAAFLGTATVANGTIDMIAANPQLGWYSTGQAADAKRWNMVGSSAFTLRTLSDDGSAANNIFSVTRGVGAAISDLSFGNALNNPTYNFLGTGKVTVPNIQGINANVVVFSCSNYAFAGGV